MDAWYQGGYEKKYAYKQAGGNLNDNNMKAFFNDYSGGKNKIEDESLEKFFAFVINAIA